MIDPRRMRELGRRSHLMSLTRPCEKASEAAAQTTARPKFRKLSEKIVIAKMIKTEPRSDGRLNLIMLRFLLSTRTNTYTISKGLT